MARAEKKYCNYCGLEGDGTEPLPNDEWWIVRKAGTPLNYDYCSHEHMRLDLQPDTTRPAPVNPLPPGLNRPRPPQAQGGQ